VPSDVDLDQPDLLASGDEESFPDVSPTPSMVGSPAERSRGSPRVGRHSTARVGATVGPVHANAAKKKKGARDVWTFFQEMDDGCFCVFCQ
jgi:hypothetical protein